MGNCMRSSVLRDRQMVSTERKVLTCSEELSMIHSFFTAFLGTLGV